MTTTITVSSRALGPRLKVRVLIYDTLDELRTAGHAYNGCDTTHTLGLTQARSDQRGRAVSVLVRLARGRLGTQIVVHEMHHASTALYGSHYEERHGNAMWVTDHLTHHNEPFAHLHSDLVRRLVDRLYALGYYGEKGAA